MHVTYYLDLSGRGGENRLKGGKNRSRETSQEMNAIIQLRDERGFKQDRKQDGE